MLAGTRGYSSSFVYRIRDAQFRVLPAVRALGTACLEHEVPITMVAELFVAAGAAQESQIFAFASDVEGGFRLEIRRM